MQIIWSRRGSIPVSTFHGNRSDFSRWLRNPREGGLYRVKIQNISSMVPDPTRSWHLRCSVFWKSVTSYPEFPSMHRCVSYKHQNEKHAQFFLAKCIGKKFRKFYQILKSKKNPNLFGTRGSQWPLTIKTSGTSGYPRSALVDVVVTEISKNQTVTC